MSMNRMRVYLLPPGIGGNDRLQGLLMVACIMPLVQRVPDVI
jgi:hypothetical protein